MSEQKSYNIIGDACYVDPDATMPEALQELLNATGGRLVLSCRHYARIQCKDWAFDLWSEYPEIFCSCAQEVETVETVEPDTTPCPDCKVPRCYPPEADCENGSWHTFPQPSKRPETEAEIAAVQADLERLPGFHPFRA